VQYQGQATSLLPDICAFLDPHFKKKFTSEDKPMVKLIDEIKAYDAEQ